MKNAFPALALLKILRVFSLLALVQACSGINPLDSFLKEDTAGLGGAIRFDPSTLNFGNSAQAPSYIDRTVTLTNTSEVAIYIDSLSSEDHGFSVLSHTCALAPLPLDAGSSCEVEIRFSPSSTGDHSGVMTTRYGLLPEATTSLSVDLGLAGRSSSEGVGNAGLSFNPSIYDFGNVALTPSFQERSFEIENITESPLYISGFASNSSQFTVQSHTCAIAPLEIAPGATCNVVLRFTALVSGNHAAYLSATYGTSDLDAGNLVARVAVSGTSTATQGGNPALTFNPDFWDFGDQALNSINEKTFTVTNISSSTIFVERIEEEAAAVDISVLSSNCPVGLNPFVAGATCSVTVRYIPTTQGVEASDIEVFYGATAGTNTALRTRLVTTGRSSPAPISSGSVTFTPNFWDFGDVARNQSVGKTVSIHNGSTSAIFIDSIERSSGATFALSNLDCPILGSGLAAGSSCQVNMIFTPNSDGSYSSELAINYGPNIPQAQSITSKMVLIGRSTQTPIGNSVPRFTPGFHDFGDIAVGGSAQQQITLQNPAGSPPIYIGGLVSSDADFLVQASNCPTGSTSLAAASSCSFTLRYLPSVTGVESTELTVSYGLDQARNTSLSRSMSAAGRSTPGGTGNAAYTFSPSYWDFGDVAANVTVQKVIEVTNSSPDAVYISNVSRSNASLFGVSHDCPISPSPLAASASCNVTVTFTPVADGSQSSLVSLIYGPDAPRAGNLTARVAVAGRSTAATRGNSSLAYTPAYWDFGDVPRNTYSEKVVTITNTSLSSVYISTSNFDLAGSFQITNNTCPTGASPLLAAATCTVTLRFFPASDVLENTSLRTYYGPDQVRSGNLISSMILAGRSVAVPSGQAILASAPSYFDYGDVAQTNSVSRAFVLTNNSPAATYISSVTRSNTGAFNISHNCPLSPLPLASSATCTVMLDFAPNAEGAHSTQVSIAHGTAASTSSNLSYAFFAQGRSTAAATGNSALTFTPSFYDFGDIAAGAFATTTVSVANNGLTPVYLGSATFDNARFSVTANTCPTGTSTLAAAATCSVTLRFAPVTEGAQAGNLHYTYGSDAVRRENLVGRMSTAGRSTAAPLGNQALSFAPTTWDFGDVATGQSAPKVFTVTNTYALPLHLSNVTSSSNRFTLNDNCPRTPLTLAAAATCDVTVTFSPNADGGFAGDIALVYGPDAERSGNLNSFLGVVGRSTAQPVGNPALRFNPSYRDFGNVPLNEHETFNFMLENTKNVAYFLGTVSVTEADYTITSNNCPNGGSSLPALSSCTISVKYQPSNEGTDIAELRVAYGPDQARRENLIARSTLIGKSEPPPVGNSAITLSPNSHDFGSVGLSPAFATTSLTLSNSSGRNLYLGPMSGLTSPYSVQATTCPLSPTLIAPGASCTITVRFEPVAGAQVTQTLTIDYGVSSSNPSEYNSQAQLTGRSNPNPPTNFQFVSGTATSLSFSWDANDFDQASFEIERCEGVNCTSTFVTAATDPAVTFDQRSYTASNLTEGQIYRFRIRGVAGATRSAWLTSPATIAFGGITSVDNSEGQAASLSQIDCNEDNTTGSYVGLYWNNVSNAAYYQVFDTESGSPVFIDNVAAGRSSVVMKGIPAGTDKSYIVKAFTRGGVGSVNNVSSSLTTVEYTPCAVIGQSNGFGSDLSWSMTNPRSVALYDGKMFVADQTNNRVLIWNSIPTSDNTPADVVLGQPDFDSSTVNSSGSKTAPSVVSARSLNSPRGVYAARNASDTADYLYVADTINNRVLVWDHIPTSNFEPATWVLGQLSFSGNVAIGTTNCGTVARNQGRGMYQPHGVFVDDDGHLYVTDTANQRVLVWTNEISQSTQVAQIVLGQASITGNCPGASTTRSTFRNPSNVYVSNNDVFVADRENHRVLRFVKPLSSGMNASNVLGQPNFTSNTAACANNQLNNPYGLSGDNKAGSSNLYVADYSNHRVLRFNSDLFDDTAPVASSVIGRSVLTTCAASNAADGVNGPIDVFSGASDEGAGVWVAGYGGNRITRYSAADALGNLPTANLLLGQPRYGVVFENPSGVTARRVVRPSGFATATTHAGDRSLLSDFATNRVLLFDGPFTAHLPTASRVLGQTTFTSNLDNQNGSITVPSANSLYQPAGVWTDGTRVLVADSGNNRVLGWRNWPSSNGQAADYVLGQNGFNTRALGTGTNQLRAPYHVFVSPIQGGGASSVNIWVVDRDNHRVVSYQGIWSDLVPKFPTDNGQSHALVLGHSATSGTSGARVSADGFSSPRAVWSDGQRVVVADTGNHRVLVWNGSALPSTGQAADFVLGQPDFVTNTSSATVGISAASLNTPTSVHVDEAGRLFVVDQGNHRVLVWNNIDDLSDGKDADRVIGQSNFVSGAINGGNTYPTFSLLRYPMQIFEKAGRLFLSDGFNVANQLTQSNGRVLVMPSP